MTGTLVFPAGVVTTIQKPLAKGPAVVIRCFQPRCEELLLEFRDPRAGSTLSAAQSCGLDLPRPSDGCHGSSGHGGPFASGGGA